MGRTPCQAGSSRARATGGARLDLFPQPGEAAPAQQPQHLGVAPFGAASVRQELTLHDPARRREPPQSPGDHRHAQRVTRCDRIRAERPVAPCVPRHQVAQRVGQRFGKRLRDTGRQRHAQRVAQSPSVFYRRPAGLAAHPDLERAARTGQLRQPAGGRLRHRAPRRRLLGRHRPDGAQQVGQPLDVPAFAVRREPLQLTFGVGHDGRVQQLAQVGLAEQVGQQRRVEGQRLRAPFGERRFTLVHESADVTEEQ